MKTLLVLLFAITSMSTTVPTQETETVKATFTEYTDGIYYFKDKNDYSMEFENIEEKVLVQYDLKGGELKGKVFMISYTTDTEEDEEGDEIGINTIIGLKIAE